MLRSEFTGQFRKDYKTAIKKGCRLDNFESIVTMISNEETLPTQFKDHAVSNTGKYNAIRECHIEQNWILTYKICKDVFILKRLRTWTHKDFF